MKVFTVDFDFEQHVRSYRYRRWCIDSGSGRISKVFAAQYVLGLHNLKHFQALTRRTNRVRRLWILKLKDMAARRFWLLSPKGEQNPDAADFDIKKFNNRLRRCMHCRPTHVHFASKDGHSVEIRPCWRVRICPFCWLNLTVALFVYCKKALNTLTKDDKDLVVVCRIVRSSVRARGFNATTGCSQEKIKQYIKTLRAALQRHKQAYAKLAASKQLSRKTVGSLWRVVVIPNDHGWLVESRQFMVCRRGQKPPTLMIHGAKCAHQIAFRLTDLSFYDASEAFFHALGPFCQYPMELLTGYTELTAAYLNASYDMRLISGTGIWAKTGRSLIRFMRTEIERVKTKAEARARLKDSETAAQDAGVESPDFAPVRSVV